MPATVTHDPCWAIACPKCRAKPGERCKNYLGKGKFTCKERICAFTQQDSPTPAPSQTEKKLTGDTLWSTPLAQVPGFPSELLAPLAAYKFVTVGDLVVQAKRKHEGLSPPSSVFYGLIRSTPPIDDIEACRKASSVLADWLAYGEFDRPCNWKDRPVKMAHITEEPEMARTAKAKKTDPPQPCGCPAVVNGLKGAHRPGCPYTYHATRTGDTMAVWDDKMRRGEPVCTPSAKAQDDFDENTPPPRTRPKGDPVGSYIILPAGESVTAEFLRWDRVGRVPPGSILAEFIGTGPAHSWPGGKESGYRVALDNHLGKAGTAISAEAIERYRIHTLVIEKIKPRVYWCVLSPMESKGGHE